MVMTGGWCKWHCFTHMFPCFFREAVVLLDQAATLARVPDGQVGQHCPARSLGLACQKPGDHVGKCQAVRCCKAKEGGWYRFYVSDIIEDFINIRIQASKKTEQWMEIWDDLKHQTEVFKHQKKWIWSSTLGWPFKSNMAGDTNKLCIGKLRKMMMNCRNCSLQT